MTESSTGVSPVFVDCTGVKILLDEVVCEVSERPWHFVISPDRKRGKRFHLGLFVNNAAHARDVFRYPRNRRVCALLESPLNACYRDLDELVRRFPIIFTHQRHLLERGEPFASLMFGTNWINVVSAEDANRIRDEHPPKSKLVSFVGSLQHVDEDAYRFRREVAEYCMSRGDVDCFGKGIREIAGKHEALSPYRFSIAMENAASDHYFSEKLVDCILMETIPIYYGCPGIGALLDSRGLLTFQTLDELPSLLERLSPGLYTERYAFALENKRRVLDQRWHSHQGVFDRIAERLSHNGVLPKAQSASRLRRLLRRIW